MSWKSSDMMLGMVMVVVLLLLVLLVLLLLVLLVLVFGAGAAVGVVGVVCDGGPPGTASFADDARERTGEDAGDVVGEVDEGEGEGGVPGFPMCGMLGSVIV